MGINPITLPPAQPFLAHFPDLYGQRREGREESLTGWDFLVAWLSSTRIILIVATLTGQVCESELSLESD